MSRYLVTGGAGFIGSHTVDALVAQGHGVRVFDDFSTGSWENLQQSRAAIEVVEGDLRDAEAVDRAMRGVDYVIHAGALRSVPRSVDDPVATHEINVTGTLHLLLSARQHKVRRVVFSSSSSVYGNTTVFPQREEHVPAPISPYAASKLAGEAYCRVFTDVYGVQTVSLRYFNVFGPRQDPASQYAAVIAIFALRMLKCEAPEVHGDGRQSRDFTYVENVVAANLAACTVAGIGGQVFNVACGDQRSVLDIVQALNRILGTSISPTFGPRRQGDVDRTLADVSKAQRELRCPPSIGFDDGLARTVAWFRAQGGGR